MNWYKGSITEAVAESLTKNAIFTVFVAGDDPNTHRLEKMLSDEKVRMELESENFITIRIESQTEAYLQFASIYQMVPVPSIFFIGKSGTPIEVGTGIMQTVDELLDKIKRTLDAQGKVSAGSAVKSNEVTAEEEKKEVVERQEDMEIVCENGVCTKKRKECPHTEVSPRENEQNTNSETTAEVEGASGSEGSADLAARLDATRKILEQKRLERIEEEKKLEKEREMRRRREGKAMQHMQEWQRETELKELKANIRRERLEQEAARERIRAQIAADRAERAQKFNIPASPNTQPTTSSAAVANNATANASTVDSVRLQFRCSNRDAQAHSFNARDTIALVRDYVKNELLAGSGIKEFILATAYPRHEFTVEDDAKTLLELGLSPSAVILVISKESAKPKAMIVSSGGVIGIMSTIFWTLISPMLSIYNYMRNAVSNVRNAGAAADAGAQKRAADTSTQNEASKRRNLDRLITGPSTSKEAAAAAALRLQADTEKDESKPYRRYGTSNVHRLSDNHKDSDDENATWNGNSTQQQ